MPEKIKLPHLIKAFALFIYWLIGALVIWGIGFFFLVHKDSNFQHIRMRNVCCLLYLCLYLIFLHYATRSFLQKKRSWQFYLPVLWSLALIGVLMGSLYRENPEIFHSAPWNRFIHRPQSVAEEADQCGITEQWTAPELFSIVAKPGQYVSKDFDEAFMWCQKAANAGNVDAQTTVGSFYEREKNYDEARKWYRLATAQGNVRAKYNLAMLYIHDAGVENFPEAASLLHEIMRSSASGLEADHIANAQASLGELYKEGKGVPQNYAEALKWFHAAADKNNGLAQFNLGLMYEKGLGIKQDYGEAAKWYLKAQTRYTRANYNLAVMYEKGLGVKQNNDEAFNFYLRAAQNYDADAQAWLRQQAESGKIKAEYELGHMYEHGFGVDEEYGESIKWYQMAAEQGDLASQKQLGFVYQMCTWDNQGTGPEEECKKVRKRYVDAYFWLSIAAKSGDEEYIKRRDLVAKDLTPEKIETLNTKISQWKPTPITVNNIKNP